MVSDRVGYVVRVPSSAIEPLESRRLLNAAPVQNSPPPFVAALYVGGSTWTQSFRDHLVASRPNSSDTYGLSAYQYFSGPPSPYDPGWELPWVNIDRFSARFNSDMLVEADDLIVRGVNVPETIAMAVHSEFDSANQQWVATWTLEKPLHADRVFIELQTGPDGVRERHTGVPLDGNLDGTPGDNFRLRVNVLPGAVGNAHRVTQFDIANVRAALMTSSNNPGTSGSIYTDRRDVNGDGRVNVMDLSEVRARVGTGLPISQPTVASATATTSPLRLRPANCSLFSSAPVLA